MKTINLTPNPIALVVYFQHIYKSGNKAVAIKLIIAAWDISRDSAIKVLESKMSLSDAIQKGI